MIAHVRPEAPEDRKAVWVVHRLAFGRDTEADLVDALRDGGFGRLSLVAEKGRQIVGHVSLSDLPIVDGAGTVAALALAPLAVLPDHQRQGIGAALVRQGLETCRNHGHRIVIVLGDPAY